MTSLSEFQKMNKEEQKAYWEKHRTDLPSVADTLLICLLTHLRNTGILGKDETMKMMSNFQYACEDTPLYNTECFYHISMFLMELIRDPVIDATIALHKRHMKEKRAASKEAKKQKE